MSLSHRIFTRTVKRQAIIPTTGRDRISHKEKGSCLDCLLVSGPSAALWFCFQCEGGRSLLERVRYEAHRSMNERVRCEGYCPLHERVRHKARRCCKNLLASGA
jgi:hypothetical protein